MRPDPGRPDHDHAGDHLGTYALALDGRKQPCRVRSSIEGRCPFGGIAAPNWWAAQVAPS